MNHKLIDCDDRQLAAILRTDDGAEKQAALAEHVETCSHCQKRLQELAASDDDWRRVGHVLSNVADTEATLVLPTGQSTTPRFPRWLDRHVEWNESMVRQLLQPPSHPEMLGRLGRYEIERLIGSGGMGIVFKAYDSELNRAVAIKLLAPYLAAGGSARKRFAREARSAAGIVDDHVVPIHNVESESEPPFLVMQYIAGGSLQEKLDRGGPLEVSEVLRIGLQTAKGLAAAHAQGLIHRDVKPSNILLDEGVERALLTDFGLARTEDDACLTRSGFQPGTPHYMSPEQVCGEAIDPRSDLFSLGCVLYALCTGRPPFRAETSYAVLRRITDESPRPIREVNPNIPEWLERIVLKLLEKSPDDRFESADGLAGVLADCLAHVQNPASKTLPKSITELSPRRGFRPPWLKVLAASALIMSMIFAGVLIVLESRKGTIRIESDADGVPIVIKKGDEVVDRLTVSQDGASIRVAADEYRVEIGGGFDGVRVKESRVDDSRVTVTRGQTSVVTITKIPRTDSATSAQASAADLRREGNPDTSGEQVEQVLQQVLARCDVVRSGRFVAAHRHGFPHEWKGRPVRHFHTYLLSGQSWLKQSGFQSRSLRVSHGGKLMTLSGPSGSKEPNHLAISKATSAREIDDDVSPFFAGTVWSETTRNFLRTSRPKLAGKETIDGVETLILEWPIPKGQAHAAMPSANSVTAAGGTLRIHAAPELGYALPRIDVVSSDGTLGFRFESTGFKQVAPNIYFPMYSAWKGFDPDPAFTQEYYFKEVTRVNADIPASDFEFTIKKGVGIVDALVPDHTVFNTADRDLNSSDHYAVTHAPVNGVFQ